MAEQSEDAQDVAEEIAPSEVAEAPREITETEKKLRREVARYREQARLAQNERDVACATAARERDEAIAAARDEARGRVLQAELKTHAIRSGIHDLDALKLVELDAVGFDEGGNAVGVEEAISSLRQRKPYLFASEAQAVGTGTTAQMLRPPQPVRPASLDARSLSREAWQAERDRLLAGKR